MQKQKKCGNKKKVIKDEEGGLQKIKRNEGTKREIYKKFVGGREGEREGGWWRKSDTAPCTGAT